MFARKLGWCGTCLVTTGAPKVRHIGNTIKNANATSISCHSHSFRVTEGVNSFIFYFNGSGSNAFRTCSKGSRFSQMLNGTIGPVLVSHPNPNPNLAFSLVRFGFGPRFRTEPSHHYQLAPLSSMYAPSSMKSLRKGLTCGTGLKFLRSSSIVSSMYLPESMSVSTE